MITLSKRNLTLTTSVIAILVGLSADPVRAQATLPTGGNVVAGSAKIAPAAAGQMTINQSSNRAVITWNNFDVGQSNGVTFNQPDASSATLNRVTGSTSSTIAGQINATGGVYLINPNGIAITKEGVVTVGRGFVASTLDITNADFITGAGTLSGQGGSVSNAGTIRTGVGGFVGLLGGSVSNTGLIVAPAGQVVIGAGTQATLDVNGDSFLQVTLPSSAAISGDGTTAVLSAAAARTAVRNIVNLPDTMNAQAISGENGNVTLSGTITASGGSIVVSAPGSIALAGAVLDASSSAGGGSIRIGGDEQGTGSLIHATNLNVDAASIIRADALTTGNGGSVVLWSDNRTDFGGSISAQGGALSGNGGSAEVSSHGVLAYTGTTNLLSPNGKTGTLLLDPYNVTISSGADTGGFTATADDSVINNGTLNTALTTANVTVSTGSSGTQAGNITIGAPLSWTTLTTLTLNAAGAIAINAQINVAGAGGVSLIDNSGLSFGNGASINYGATNQGGTFSHYGTNYTLIYNMSDLAAINGGTGADALATRLDASSGNYTAAIVGSFGGTFEGLGNSISKLTITGTSNIVGLFGTLNPGGSIYNIGLIGGNVSGGDLVGALAGINAGGNIFQSYSTSAVSGDDGAFEVGGLVGLNDGGSIHESYAAGEVSGGVNSTYVGGLVGFNNGTIVQSHANGAVSGTNHVGGLAGGNSGGIFQSHANGSVAGTSQIGGLVGVSYGNIFQSGANGAVSGASNIGGLVGQDVGGTISQSFATGATTGGDNSQYIGGLVGYQLTGSSLTQSYATGAVNGGDHSSYVGGLVGVKLSGSSLSQSYATGAVNGGANSSDVGGLVGGNEGDISNSYATGSVTGGSYVGGLAGVNLSNIDHSYATGSANGNLVVGGLIGYDSGSIAQTYATGAVTGTQVVGGLVGFEQGNVIQSYWDSQTTGKNAGFGGINGGTFFATGLTSAQARSSASYAGWDFANDWYQVGDMRPILRSEAASPVGGVISISNLHQLALVGADLNASYKLAQNIDASGTSGSNPSGIWNSTGFVPLGTDGASNILGSGNGFAGLFDGQDHTISNLSINRPAASYVGLFGYVSGGGTITDLGVIDGSIYGQQNFVGGLVGYNYSGTISNAYATGAVSGRAQVGGLVGFNHSGTISNSYATGAVSGTSDVGGLVGSDAFGTISNTYATGAVSGSSGSLYVGGLVGSGFGSTIGNAYATGGVSGSAYVGGLVGFNDSGTISNAHATGAASGNNVVGGLVGYNESSTIGNAYATGTVSGSSDLGGLVGFEKYGTISNAYATGAVSASTDVVGGLVGFDYQSTITNSYATGAVSGFAYVGGLIGYNNDGGTISGSYWDVTTSGQAGMCGYAGGSGCNNANGLTSAQARNAASYSGWDFSNVWYQVGDMRPILRSEAALPVDGIISITNLHQLALVGADLNASYALGQDIDATETSGSDPSGIWDTTGFVPLGTDGAGNIANFGFAGLFNGQDHVISNLAINRPSSLYVGLFGFVGPSGMIEHARVQSEILSGSSFVGGLAGWNGGSITRSYATGSVSGGGFVGGLVGGNLNGGTIIQSYAGVNVSGSGQYVGGLVGNNDGFSSITNSYATGSVAGFYQVGGLVGYSGTTGSIAKSFATGNVTGSEQVGGLAGMNHGSIRQTYATGKVSGNLTTGGLVGFNSNIISDSYATGNVSGAQYAGGLVGVNYGNISRAYANGNVSGINPGGLLAYNGGSIFSSYWDTTTSGQAGMCGGSSGSGCTNANGLTTSQLQEFSNYTTNYAGWDFGSVWSPPSQAGQAGQTSGYYPQLYALTPVAVATPDSVSRSYGADNPALNGSIAGGGPDTYAFGPNADTLSTAGLFTTSATAASNVGNYAITSALSETITSTGEVVYRVIIPTNSALAINPASLAVTYTAEAASMIYGQIPSGFTGTVSESGLVNGDTLAGVTSGTVNWTTPATNTSNVGSYAINGAGLSGNSSNYTFDFIQAAGNATALTIDPASLTVITAGLIGSTAKTYDGTMAATLTSANFLLSGFVNSDGASVNQTVGTFASANVGTGIEVTASLTPADFVANFGTNLANYTLPTSASGNIGIINTRALSVTANSGQSSVYGAAIPTLSYAVGATDTTSGLVNGDTLSGALATTATTASNVGLYAITKGTLAASANYALTYTGANLAITQRNLTVTANAQSRMYGIANPALTYAVGGLGLVNGDTLSGALATTATKPSNVGLYAITRGTLAASANYALTYAGANLSVTQRDLTVTANAQSRMYGNANPALTYTTGGSGLVNGDKLTGLLATTANTTSNVGLYAITRGTLAASSNYALTYTPANLAVTQRNLTVTANAQSRIYGSTNPALTYAVGGSGLVNADTLSGALATTAATTSNVGLYAIMRGTLAASANYAVSYTGANLSINPATLTYVANAATRHYKTANPDFLGTVTGFILGQTLASATTGALQFLSPATINSTAGSYAINGSGLTANFGNYIFVQAPSNATALTITKP